MSGTLAGRHITALACFDSFGKMAMTLLARCRREGASTTLHLLELPRRSLSRRQRLEIRRIDPRTRVEQHGWGKLGKLVKSMPGCCDALVLGLDGQRSRQILLELQRRWHSKLNRPLLVSAYPGILFRHQLEGMMDRSGADLLCLNSSTDFETYALGCEALGIDASNAVVTGLPILWDLAPRLQVPDRASIVFFEQPSIPANPLQRRYLCTQLLRLAECWPDHQVIFKPRTSSLESTLHRSHGEMTKLISKLATRVDNLRISLQPAQRLLRQSGCAITISSSAALEAMAMGVSTRIVADLGVNESLGNHYFAGSGALADFDAIAADPFTPKHNSEWLASRGYDLAGSHRFATALAVQLAKPSRPLERSEGGPPGWGSASWQSFALAHGGPLMLSSAGSRSTLRKRHRTLKVLRWIRIYMVGVAKLAPWLKGR
jgi:hypothetical protein